MCLRRAQIMCLRRAPEKYIAGAKVPAGAALDRAGLDNWLTDGGEVVSLKYRCALLPRNLFSVSGTHFC
jgi:hypothetical protein